MYACAHASHHNLQNETHFIAILLIIMIGG